MATARTAPIEISESDRDMLAAKFGELIETVRKNRPSDDTEIIRKAWDYCLEHHNGQLRASGERRVLHPLEVAQVLAETESWTRRRLPPDCCMMRSKILR